MERGYTSGRTSPGEVSGIPRGKLQFQAFPGRTEWEIAETGRMDGRQFSSGVKSSGSGVRQIWAGSPALTLMCCVVMESPHL